MSFNESTAPNTRIGVDSRTCAPAALVSAAPVHDRASLVGAAAAAISAVFVEGWNIKVDLISRYGSIVPLE